MNPHWLKGQWNKGRQLEGGKRCFLASTWVSMKMGTSTVRLTITGTRLSLSTTTSRFCGWGPPVRLCTSASPYCGVQLSVAGCRLPSCVFSARQAARGEEAYSLLSRQENTTGLGPSLVCVCVCVCTTGFAPSVSRHACPVHLAVIWACVRGR